MMSSVRIARQPLAMLLIGLGISTGSATIRPIDFPPYFRGTLPTEAKHSSQKSPPSSARRQNFEREGDVENCAASGRVFSPDAPLVALNDASADRKSQAGASPARGLGKSLEGNEDGFDPVRRYARAVVLHI